MLAPCPDSVSCEVSQTRFSSSFVSFLLLHPLLFITSPCLHCVCVCLCMCASGRGFFSCRASVSPCWQRGITAPGIESSSQAFGWRSTSETKRMLVHLKVAAAAAVPVDVFAVSLSVIFKPGWFGSFSRISTIRAWLLLFRCLWLQLCF